MEKETLTSQLPVVAIVGRPNVGKSTLFNRIVGRRKAVVLETPGLTRDRNYAPAEWEGKHFLLVDTGGYDPDDSTDIAAEVREQTLLAIDEAEVVVVVTDVREPDNPLDEQVVALLRKRRQPFLLAVNKCDNKEYKLESFAFSKFGIETIFPVSSLHGIGVDALLDDVVKLLPQRPDAEELPRGVRIAVVGRQNVGKSTLVNRLLGKKRAIVSPIPGTTRDAIDSSFQRRGQFYTLIDTAGIRRRGKIERGIEKLSVLSCIMSLERCDVALLVLDAFDGVIAQDAHIAGFALEAGRAIILLVNKWDKVEKTGRTADQYLKALREEFKFIPFAPVLFISALTGERVEKIFSVIDEVMPQFRAQFDTAELNKVVEAVIHRHPPPVRSGSQLKIKYATQTATAPPTFTLFVNNPQHLHFSYERYFMNQLHNELGLDKVPIRLRWRRK
jgi:GTP-binding protein